MIRFSLFGIPISVEPMFWLVSFMLGGGLTALMGNGDSKFAIVAGLVWVVAVFISILVHELGHAITGLKLGGGSVWIKLWAFGGLAYNQGGQFSKKNRAIMIAMGPGAGFLLYLFVLVICIIMLGSNIALDLAHYSIGKIYGPLVHILTQNVVYYPSEELVSFTSNPANTMKFIIFDNFFTINLFWGLVNLIPVMPLDGGQLLHNYSKSPKKVFLIGAIASTCMAILGAFAFGSLFIPVLFGFLAYNNFNSYKEANY